MNTLPNLGNRVLSHCPKLTVSHESTLIRLASRHGVVIPAQAGIQKRMVLELILDSRVRGNDGLEVTAVQDHEDLESIHLFCDRP